MPVGVQALDQLVINVADVAVTTEWYRKILGMEVKVFDPGGGKAPRTSLRRAPDQNDPSATGLNACNSC